MIFQIRPPARIDDYASATGPLAEANRKLGLRAAVGVPVSVEGATVGRHDRGSTLAASRARIVATADATCRRIERNLHDGAQQRLVTLALDLRAAHKRRRGTPRRRHPVRLPRCVIRCPRR